MNSLTRASLAHPRTASLVFVVWTLAMAAGLPRIQSDVGYRAFLGASQPSVQRFDALLERFGGGLPLIAMWTCGGDAPGTGESPCSSALAPSALRMAWRVEARLRDAPGITGTVSPASALLLLPSSFGPEAAQLVDDESGEPAEDLAELALVAARDPAWLRQLISGDGRSGAIALEVASSSSEDAQASYAALEAALAPEEAAGFVFSRVGGPVEFVVAGAELERAIGQLVPVMVALVAVALLLLFGSPTAAALALASVGLAVVWTMGLLGWLSLLGWGQNSLTQTLPPLVLAIGVCDAVHLISRYAKQGAAGSEAVAAAAGDVAGPCWITTLTTAAGFLSFLAADLEAFGRYGLLAGFGVFAAYATSFGAMPLALARIAPQRLQSARAGTRFAGATLALADAGSRRPWIVLTAATLALAGGAVGMQSLRVDASFEELYGERSQVVRWTREVGERLRRPDTLEVELRLPPGAELASRSLVSRVDDVATKLAALPGLGPARSYTDALRHIRSCFEDAPIVPPDEVLLGLAAAFAEDEGAGAARFVRDAPLALRISVESEKLPQEQLRQVMAEAEQIVAASGFEASLSGPLELVHTMVAAIQRAQLASFAVAAVLVLILVASFLRSFSDALRAMVPTLLPVVVTLGAMGAAGVPLDVGTAMVAAVVIGVAVDDAVHLLSAYRRERREGRGSSEAMRRAVLRTADALTATSVALAVGFSVLSLSPWQSVAGFGQLAAIAILSALAATLLVLPALVAVASRAGEGDED